MLTQCLLENAKWIKKMLSVIYLYFNRKAKFIIKDIKQLLVIRNKILAVVFQEKNYKKVINRDFKN